jgi:hypothetical protein
VSVTKRGARHRPKAYQIWIPMRELNMLPVNRVASPHAEGTPRAFASSSGKVRLMPFGVLMKLPKRLGMGSRRLCGSVKPGLAPSRRAEVFRGGGGGWTLHEVRHSYLSRD